MLHTPTLICEHPPMACLHDDVQFCAKYSASVILFNLHKNPVRSLYPTFLNEKSEARKVK